MRNLYRSMTWAVLLVALALAPACSPNPAMRAPIDPEAMTVARSAPATRSAVAAVASAGTSTLKALPVIVWNSQRQRSEVQLIDPQQGRPLGRYAPIEVGQHYAVRLSPDGRQLAIVAYPNQDDNKNGVLHLIDVQTWRDVTATVAINQWLGVMAFNSTGTQLVLASNDYDGPSPTYNLLVVDVATRSVTAQATLDFPPLLIEYAPGDQSLVVYGSAHQSKRDSNQAPRVVLLKASDLSIEWTATLNEVLDGAYPQPGVTGPEADVFWTPAVVFSLDRSRLYVVHADTDQLTTVDVTRRAVSTVSIAPARSWLEQLLTGGTNVAYAKEMNGATKTAVLSRDGSRLYVVGSRYQPIQAANGDWQPATTPTGLQVVEVATGTELARFETKATEIDLSTDGQQIYLYGWDNSGDGWPWTDIVDAKRLEVVAHLDKSHILSVRQLNGQSSLLSVDDHTGDTAVAVLDARSLTAIHHWSMRGYVVWLTAP